jgi:hypothetical protein
MHLLQETPGLLEALKGEMTPKFLATRSTEGAQRSARGLYPSRR